MKVLLLILPLGLIACSSVVQKPCNPVVIEKPVIQKCVVPEVQAFQLEVIQKSDPYEIKLEKLIRNYGKLKEENLLLREAIKVCQ